ncbi:MAG: type II toxin-antitoxin system RelE/ParE family toxin [Planctomycetota bacterium]
MPCESRHSVSCGKITQCESALSPTFQKIASRQYNRPKADFNLTSRPRNLRFRHSDRNMPIWLLIGKEDLEELRIHTQETARKTTSNIDTMYHLRYNSMIMAKQPAPTKRLPAAFFANSAGEMPVRTWLLSLSVEDRKIVGDDIRTAEFGWPIGMPLCRSLSGRKGLWEIRSHLTYGRIARVLFCTHNSTMVLLHGFIKKTQQTPTKELQIAVARQKGLT